MLPRYSLMWKILSFNVNLYTNANWNKSVFSLSTTVYFASLLGSKASKIINLAMNLCFMPFLKAVFPVGVVFAPGFSSLLSFPILIPYSCFCYRSWAISVAHCALFVHSNLVMVMAGFLILKQDLKSNLSVIIVSQTLQWTSSSHHQTHSWMMGSCLSCGDHSA